MKIKLLLSLLVAGALSVSAQQGYKDGVEYFKAGQYENAKTLLERNLNDASTDKAVAYYYLGAIAVHDKDLTAAKSDFEKGLAADPNNAFNKVGLGELALMGGDAKAASNYFDEARKINKKNAKVMVAIARAYFNTDPVKYAKEIDKNLEQAYKANKQEPDIFVLRGDMKAAEKEWGDAAGNYENAILYSKGLPEAYVKYANAYFNVNPEYAIAKLQELLKESPNSALGQRELAEKYYQNDQWAKAASAYGDYINNPNHFTEDEVRYSVLLYYGQHYDESIAIANKLLASDPNNFQLQRIAFLDKAAMKDYTAAKQLAQRFFALNDPKNKYTSNDYSTYAQVLEELGEDSLAVFEYEKALEVNPEKGDLYKALSSAYSGMKNYDKALEVFKNFIDRGDYVTNDLVILANRYQNVAATSENGSEKKQNAINNAIATIDQVIERVPDHYVPVRNKARMFLVKNDNQPSKEMADTYMQVVSMLDKDPENKTKNKDVYNEAYSQIAFYYISERDVPMAKEYYEKVYELDPTNQALRDYIDKMK
ncbi:lipopolysaccharide assembly protein LapB [uncultured Muribaculum sp.]|uniref:tetratricopeptide repeat protein n=1 Tax=uncultured Muribaculum sp. TaxID=1918613 RepID=UPI002658305F|nr:tetratricopeptide repeat protein [uncultured Muribaculum sp.]